MRGAAIQIVRLLAVILCGAVLLGGRPALAEPVQIRTAPHEGYGRIVFNWQAAVPYTAELIGNRLTVIFGRPLEADVGAAVRTLSRYLRSGEIGSDGRSVTFVTAGDFGLRTFDLGQAVVVDLLDGAATPAPAPQTTATITPPAEALPAPAAAASEPPRNDVPGLGVRAGEHDGYSRIVFDWPNRVGYSVDRAGGTLTLSFDRAARPDLGGIRSRLPQFVAGIDATVRDDGLTVSMRVPETSRIRHFRSGPKVAIDVMAPGTASATAPRSAPTPAAPPQTAAADQSPPAPAPAPAEQAAEPPATEAPQTAQAPAEGTDLPAGERVANKPKPLVPVKPGALSPPPAPEGVARPTPLNPTSPQAQDPVATAAALAAATQPGGAQPAPEGRRNPALRLGRTGGGRGIPARRVAVDRLRQGEDGRYRGPQGRGREHGPHD